MSKNLTSTTKRALTGFIAIGMITGFAGCSGGCTSSGNDNQSEGASNNQPSAPQTTVTSSPVSGVVTSLLCDDANSASLRYVLNSNGSTALDANGNPVLTPIGQQCKQSTGAFTAIIDIVLIDKNGSPVDITPDSGTFTEDTVPGVVPFLTFQGVSKITLNARQGAYSAFLIFDQSGSISQTDPTNQRIAAGKTFIQQNKSPDEIGLGYFPGSNNIVTYLGSGPSSLFSQSTANQVQFLSSLAGKESGDTPLYDSISLAIDATQDYATQKNKAVVVFSDGADTASNTSIGDAISKSKTENIPIYTFALAGPDQDFASLQTLATSTGGAMLYAQSADQLIAAYGSLANLLRGNLPAYRLVVSSRSVVQAASICQDGGVDAEGNIFRTCNESYGITAHTSAGDIPVQFNVSISFRTTVPRSDLTSN